MSSGSPYDRALAAIWQRSGYDRGFISNPFAGDRAATLGLERTRRMLNQLGHPERAYPIVHVAGSKGKGSTAAFVDGIMRAADLRSGRFLSPHLHSFRERFTVGGRDIAEADFVGIATETLAVAEAVEAGDPGIGTVTAFELSTAMALLWFRRAGCDAAVVEVGLGGTLDATNVVDPAVSIISILDFEHTAILGETMLEIASNKAGIIKPGRPVVSASQPADGLAVIARRAHEMNSPLLLSGRDFTTAGESDAFSAEGPWGRIDDLALSMPGDHQLRNAGLAIAAAHVLADGGIIPRDGFSKTVTTGLRRLTLPARFEEVAIDHGTVVIDGAHTGASMTALVRTIDQRFPGAAPLVIVGMLADKDPATVLAPLARIAATCVAVSPRTPRALDPGAVRAALGALGVRCEPAASTADALRHAGRRHPLIVVTGSFAAAAEAREALGLVSA